MSLDNKIDNLTKKVDNIEKILAINTEILQEHQRRSVALEAIVEKNKEEIIPIKNYVDSLRIGIKAIIWFCGAVAGIFGFIYLISSLLKLF